VIQRLIFKGRRDMGFLIMQPYPAMNRRQFVQLGTLAAGTAMLSGRARAAAAASPFTVPALPYAFDALEPHIDAKTMEIHHGKHHAAYVAGLNAALAKAPDLAGKELAKVLERLPEIADEALRTPLRNHGGGHWNHAFFWQTLAPAAKSAEPSEELAVAIISAFGSMKAFKKSFEEAATKRFGSGWAWLIVSDGKLQITSTPNQDNPLMKGVVPASDLGIPILGLDVWEHAYYLHYQNRRTDYIAAWWNIVNWPEASKRFGSAFPDR
jgi:Fe-Mn family superoxide dismutase